MKTSPVKDQKVFVSLRSVMELQKEYLRVSELARTAESPRANLAMERVRAIGSVIKMLDLPIEVK